MPKRERAATASKSDNHLSRRDFVTRTSLIGAGLVVGPLWTGCSDQSAEVRKHHPYRVGSRVKHNEDTTARHIAGL